MSLRRRLVRRRPCGQPQKEEPVGDEGFDLFNSHVLTFLLTIKKLGGVYAGI